MTAARKGQDRRLPSNPATETLSEAAKAARRQYVNAYRKAHPERVRAWNARYWERKAEASLSNTTEAAED